MSISSDAGYVNLWDLLTDVPVGATILTERCERRRESGQRVKNKLNRAARVWGQEMRVWALDDGWTFEVYSCFDDTEKPIVTLFVPADKRLPIRVKADEDEVVVEGGDHGKGQRDEGSLEDAEGKRHQEACGGRG